MRTDDADTGDYDHGDYDASEMPQPVIDLWHMSHAPARVPVTPVQYSPELAHENVQAALCMLSKGTRPADIEAVRAAFWTKTRSAARIVAVLAAKMPKERAGEPLASFDAFERGRVNLEIDRLVEDLLQIKKCMNGGRVPSKAAVL